MKMNRTIQAAMSNLSKLSKISSVLSEISLSSSTPRYEANLALMRKQAVDANLVSNLDSISEKIAEFIGSGLYGQPSLSSQFLTNLVRSSGYAIPIGLTAAIAGNYLIGKAGKEADRALNEATNQVPSAISRIAGDVGAALGLSAKNPKYASLAAAYSLSKKLRDSAESGVKTAADLKYREQVIIRSNAHLADIVNSLVN
jgi:hypothetical protein